MQTTGYMQIDNEIILVLARFESDKIFHRTGYAVRFKLRKSGELGTHFESEEIHLKENRSLLQRLKLGETIRC